MPTRKILNSHPVTVLKKEISKTNVKGYSKLKKAEVVELMMKNKDKFHHIKMAETKASAPAKKSAEPAPPKKRKHKKKPNLSVTNPKMSAFFALPKKSKPPKVTIDPKKIKMNSYDEGTDEAFTEISYEGDPFMKKLDLTTQDIIGDGITLLDFYKKPNANPPRGYAGQLLKKLLKFLVDAPLDSEYELYISPYKNDFKQPLPSDERIMLNSPFYDDFEVLGNDPKKLLKYYESLGFKLRGKFKMVDGDDQFSMVANVKDIIKNM